MSTTAGREVWFGESLTTSDVWCTQVLVRQESGIDRAFIWVFIAIFALLMTRDAWIGDDAYITLRTVRQFVRGSGLVWNHGERVQSYTHPLWMFILSAGFGITREAYYTTLVISGIASMSAVLLLVFRRIGSTGSNFQVMIIFAFLLSSRAFIDYSTSGLENPVTHLLLMIFFGFYARRCVDPNQVLRLSFIASLIMLNRMDTILLVAPALMFVSWSCWNQTFRLRPVAKALTIGMLPFLIWECFSIFYYGSFVPNTALAKLNTGIPKLELLEQGAYYLLESLINDHVTLLAIGLGIITPFLVRDRKLWPMAVGIALYLLYILRIGGDFMSGRFLTAPFLVSLLLVGRLPFSQPKLALPVAIVVLILGLSSPRSTMALASPKTPPGQIDHRGVADERGFYQGGAGLANMSRVLTAPHHGMRWDGEHIPTNNPVVRMAIGYVGFFASPYAHIVDLWALVDPLLARLPSQRNVHWRIGHYGRPLPAGYLESRKSGLNEFQDEKLGEFYIELRKITHGDLWSWDRVKAIWKLNTGQLDYLLDKDFYQHWGSKPLQYSNVNTPKPPRAASNDPSNTVIDYSGAIIDMEGERFEANMELSVDANDDYEVVFYNDKKIVGRYEFRRAIPRGATMRTHSFEIPESVLEQGFTHARVLPNFGRAPFVFGHLRVYDGEDEDEGVEVEEDRDSKDFGEFGVPVTPLSPTGSKPSPK